MVDEARSGTPAVLAAQPLVIAVHGAVVNAATWLPLQRELGESVEIWAADLPGHGTRRGEKFALEAAIRGIEEALPTGIHARPVVLAGDSLGGYLALIAAAKLGERIGAVVAAGASFDLSGPGGMLTAMSDGPVKLFSLLAGEKTSLRAFELLVRRVTDDATAEAIIARGLRLAARSESITVLRGVDLREAVSRCRGRVYMVNGALDIPTVWYTRTFARYASNGYAVTIPWATHGCALTHAAAFADVVRTAIAAVKVDMARKTLRSRS